MKKMLLILLGFTIIGNSTNMYAQIYKNEKEIAEFVLKAEKRNYSWDDVTLCAVELLHPEMKLDTKWGIFQIGVFIDPTYTHFLLIKDGKRIYVDTNEGISRTLTTILNFLDASSVSEENKFLYLQRVLEIYIMNWKKFPDDDW